MIWIVNSNCKMHHQILVDNFSFHLLCIYITGFVSALIDTIHIFVITKSIHDKFMVEILGNIDNNWRHHYNIK